MALPPTVIYPLTLPALLRYVLSTQSDSLPTRLVICSSKEVFLISLAGALQLEETQNQPQNRPLQFAAPTLYNLLTARHVQVAFCASVQILLAYLTSLKPPPAPTNNPGSDAKQGPSERIMLVNPLGLHAATSAFSAQGLSRTFAAAVETGLRVHAQLVVAECQDGSMQPPPREHEHENEDDHIGHRQPLVQLEDPWEQEVSILNVSMRKFGDRPWAGRTIKVKRIAGRWFRFHKLDDLEP